MTQTEMIIVASVWPKKKKKQKKLDHQRQNGCFKVLIFNASNLCEGVDVRQDFPEQAERRSFFM